MPPDLIDKAGLSDSGILACWGRAPEPMMKKERIFWFENVSQESINLHTSQTKREYFPEIFDLLQFLAWCLFKVWPFRKRSLGKLTTSIVDLS